MDDLLKIQYKTNIEILIQPISSLYDLLPNRETNNYLKELYNNYSEYIEKSKPEEKDIYKIKDMKMDIRVCSLIEVKCIPQNNYR